MRRVFAALLFVCLFSLPALATRERVQGWCQDGGVAVVVPGTAGSGTQRFQQTYRSCTVTVYAAGTTTLSTIYSDAAGTAQANPFTATAAGRYFFYADGGRYDLRFSAGGIATPFTLGDFRIDNSTFNVTDYGALCDGTTNDYTAINRANTAATAQTNGGTVLIPSNVAGSCIINSSITFNSDVTLAFEGGGRISMASGTTATIAGTIQAPPAQQIFAGSGNIVVSPGRTSPFYVDWWGALGDGTAASASSNSTTIQNAITSVCGGTSTTTPVSQSTTGAHGALKFLPGVYVTTTDLIVPSACWADISGASGKGTYVFQMTGGTSAAVQINGSECTACEAPPRTASNNDGEVYLHDISIGSTTGHALSLLRAYRTKLERINLFSADVADNYLDIDGVSTLVADDIRITGNEDFPYGQYAIFGNGNAFEQGVRGIYITVREGPTAGDYNNSGEMWFNRPWVQGQQTGDAIFVDIPTADPINVYPIHIGSADLVVQANFAGVRANGQTLVLIDGATYIEGVSGTVDAIRVDSTQGNATTLESAAIFATDVIAPGVRINFNGDGTRKPNLVVKGGRYSTFVSASAVYGNLQILGVEFTSNTASAYANYTSGDYSEIDGNTLRAGSAPTSVFPWNAVFKNFAGETDPVVSNFTFAANTTASPIIACRKSRGTLAAVLGVAANDSLCGINFYGYANGGWRDGGSIQPLATAVSGSNLTSSLTFRLPSAGVSTIAMILNPTHVVVGASESSTSALLNVNGGQTHIGSGSWPTTSLAQTANNVLMSQATSQSLIMYRSDTTVGSNYGGTIFMGGRQTDSTDDFAGARWLGARTNAMSGDATAYATISTTNSGGTFVEGLRVTATTTTIAGIVVATGLTSSSTGDYVCFNTGTSEITQGTAPCTASSERYKHDIRYDNIPGIELVRKMRPISFVSNTHPEIGTQFGFKAEDVSAVEKRLTYYDAQGRPDSFAYMNYTAVLTKAVQELDKRVKQLESRRPGR